MKYHDLKSMMAMAHSPLHNYIVPGLTSYLIGAADTDGSKGCVRLFRNERHQHQHITPHSHRFDFQCLVLRGWVRNATYHPDYRDHRDVFCMSEMTYKGSPGQYEKQALEPIEYGIDYNKYEIGDWYSMTCDQIHSITFSKDAFVLFFEGPQKTDKTFVLEPWVNEQLVPTMKTEDWMFQRG